MSVPEFLWLLPALIMGAFVYYCAFRYCVSTFDVKEGK
jgi:hypothetical protein